MKRFFVILIFLLLLGFFIYKIFLLPSKKETEFPLQPTDFIQEKEEVTVGEGELVENFPDIPIYPNLTVDQTYRKETEGKITYVGLWFYEGDIHEIMSWYGEEFKKAGWSVEGPFVYEGEDELEIDAENSSYTLRLLNAEREEGESGQPGKLIMVDITQK